MTPEIDALKKLASQKITKGKLPALQKAQADAYSLSERLYPKASDEDTTSDFESACEELESALDQLDFAISDLEMAEEKDEREDAISSVEDALEQANSAFDEIIPLAIVGTEPRPAPAPAPPEFDPEVAKQVIEILKRPEQEQSQALSAWIRSAGTPEQIAERQNKLNQFIQYLQNTKQPPPAPAT